MNVVRYLRCLRFGAKSLSMSASLFWSEMGLLVPPLIEGPGRSGRLPVILCSGDTSSIFVSSDMPIAGVSKFDGRAIVRILIDGVDPKGREPEIQVLN